MKTHDFKGMDQQDAETLRAKLQLYAADLRGRIHTASGQLIKALPVSHQDENLFEDIRALEDHCGKLEALLGGSTPQFQFSAARSVSSTTGSSARTGHKVDSAPSEFSSGKETLTQRVLREKARLVGECGKSIDD